VAGERKRLAMRESDGEAGGKKIVRGRGRGIETGRGREKQT
jgi:hypothetical protein